MKLFPDGRRNQDPAVELRQDLRPADQHKVIERSGVGNDDHLAARGLLVAEPTQGLHIVLQVLLVIVQIDAMILQEPVHFHPGLKTEQPSDLFLPSVPER